MKVFLAVLLASIMACGGVTYAQQPSSYPQQPSYQTYQQPSPYGQTAQPSPNRQAMPQPAQSASGGGASCEQKEAYCEQGCGSAFHAGVCRRNCQNRQAQCLSRQR